MSIKEDPIKLHKDANALMESGKYAEARDLFSKVSGLYFKGQNYFGAAEMSYKAGECSFALKEYDKAVESFMKASEIALNKGFDRYGISALQQAMESQKALGNTEKVEELGKKISELKKKQEPPEEEGSFSVFS
jgi:tetratricopeptide (TPR) repeat protein